MQYCTLETDVPYSTHLSGRLGGEQLSIVTNRQLWGTGQRKET